MDLRLSTGTIDFFRVFRSLRAFRLLHAAAALRPCCSLLTHYRRRGPCRDGDPYQEFYVEHQDEESEGRIRYALRSPPLIASSHPPRRDGETGRCLFLQHGVQSRVVFCAPIWTI